MADPTAPLITKLDFVGVPSTDLERSRVFYVDTLGLRADARNPSEFWVGETCCGLYEPAQYGMAFQPQRLAPLALHVNDVESAKAELEDKGVEFNGDTLDTGVCHMAFFVDPDRNQLILHHRYAPHH